MAPHKSGSKAAGKATVPPKKLSAVAKQKIAADKKAAVLALARDIEPALGPNAFSQPKVCSHHGELPVSFQISKFQQANAFKEYHYLLEHAWFILPNSRVTTLLFLLFPGRYAMMTSLG